MASREREHSTAVASGAKPAETRDSAFRRGAGDFAERQIPGPRRFGFGSSPPRRHNSGNGGPSMIYERPSPPRTNGHHDTSRHSSTTILPRSSSSSSRLASMPIGLRGLSNDVRVGAGIADVIRSQQDVAVEEQQLQLQLLQQQRLLQQLQETQPPQQQQPQHPAFSQLALVLGFELAKKVTQKHPRETDMNRLANLALDITTSPAALEAVTTPPSRSASTTSATSTPSESRRRSTAFAPSASSRNQNGNRSPSYRYGGSSSRGGAPLARSRTTSTPTSSSSAGAPAAAADGFVTAVTAAPPHSATAEASAATAISPRPLSSSVVRSPTAPASPPPAFGDEYDASDLRTDATAPDDTAADDEDNDLIDFDGEAAEQVAHSTAPLIVESSHLLD